MKFFISVFSIVLVIVLFTYRKVAAQGTKEMNDSMFTEVKKQVNSRNGDGLYALLNDNFKAKFTKEAFSGLLTNSLYPMGSIKESDLLNYGAGVSNYKVVHVNAVLQYRITTDKDGKIAALSFMPYKEPAAAVKDYVVATDNAMQTPFDKQIDTIARRYINGANTVGLCIGVIKGDAVFTYGYGETTRGNKHIPGPDAIFEIGSVTKVFTTTLLAYYVQEHKVSLSDPITKYLPDSVVANKDLQQITLLMLANHTSGLPRLPDNLFDEHTDMMNPYKNYGKDKLFAWLKICKPLSAPGEKYEYSNMASGLLSTILEQVSGQTFEQMVTSIICKPLNMANTMQYPNAQQKEKLVNVYDQKGTQVILWDTEDALAGMGALKSDIHDMILYAQANLRKNSSALSDAMELTQKITFDKKTSIGLGWHKMDIDRMGCYWHNGGTGGCRSYIGFIPDKDIAVVVLSNAEIGVDATGINILKLLK